MFVQSFVCSHCEGMFFCLSPIVVPLNILSHPKMDLSHLSHLLSSEKLRKLQSPYMKVNSSPQQGPTGEIQSSNRSCFVLPTDWVRMCCLSRWTVSLPLSAFEDHGRGLRLRQLFGGGAWMGALDRFWVRMDFTGCGHMRRDGCSCSFGLVCTLRLQSSGYDMSFNAV